MNDYSEQERQLNVDGDGDGLKTREELMYGLNPYSPDTDGDGILDSQEGVISTPNELRDRYLNHARTILNRPYLSYETIYYEIEGDRYLANGIDRAVLGAALNEGKTLTEASRLLTQSPYVQFMQKQEKLRSDEVRNYLRSIVEGREQSLNQLVQVQYRQEKAIELKQ